MNVCLINNLFSPFSRGGTEKYVENLADFFRKNNHNVFVIASKPRFFRNDGKKGNNVIFINSLFYYLDKMPRFVRFLFHSFKMLDIFTAFRVLRLVKKNSCNLVIGNNLLGLSFFIPHLLIKNDIKYVHVLHDIQLLHPSGLMTRGNEAKINTLVAKIYQTLNCLFFGKCNLVISPSNWLLDLHFKHKLFCNTKSVVLHNPVKISVNINKTANNNILKILFVGQIEEHKGVIKFFQFFKKYYYKDSNVSLTIIGGGSKSKKVYSGGNIFYLGRLGEAEVKEMMKKSGLLIVPSLCYENSPTVIFEAISQNLPVLAAEVGGIGEIISKYGGVCYLPEDEKDLRTKLNLLIKNPRLCEEIRDKYRLILPEIEKKSENYIKTILSELNN